MFTESTTIIMGNNIIVSLNNLDRGQYLANGMKSWSARISQQVVRPPGQQAPRTKQLEVAEYVVEKEVEVYAVIMDVVVVVLVKMEATMLEMMLLRPEPKIG